jgi:hypothetical protein
MSIAARITRSDEPGGRELSKRDDHKGDRAEAAPSAVIKPKTSVMRDCDLLVIREPAAIPSEEPTRIATIFTNVPAPTNIV